MLGIAWTKNHTVNSWRPKTNFLVVGRLRGTCVGSGEWSGVEPATYGGEAACLAGK